MRHLLNVILVSIGAASAFPAIAMVQSDCSKVCSDVRASLKSNSKQVEVAYKQWQERLGLKGDVVRYEQGFSAAEEMLKFMSTYYKIQAPGNQMEPTFLAYMMGKCFPESYIDVSHAKMSGLVDTIWAAEHIKIESRLNTCK